MYGIALTTRACLQSHTEVHVAWAVETAGFSSRDPNEALALTPGGGRTGGVLSGAANDQLADAARTSGNGRLVDVTVNEYEAALAGLSCGGSARCVAMPASALPERLWQLLLDREPVCLALTLDDGRVTGSRVFAASELDDEPTAEDTDLVGRLRELAKSASSRTELTDERILSIFWPVPTLLLVGGGVIVDAMEQLAGFLGWQAQRAMEATRATELVVGLSRLDKLVVTSHDVEVAGPVLLTALRSPVGYIGALGSRHTQSARHDWLAVRGVSDTSAIHGPAGLDLGARTPAEIALSVLSEALATGNGRSGGPLLPTAP